ncbi:MAG: geranylgeranyl reductase family protein [Candidatus Thorarchaeota archaeon]|jgi:geranylgeranyl reductase family protein
MHDLVVVGGGPAGASCARVAALGGLDVLLIEKDIHPRAKLCAGALTRRITDLIDFSIDPIVEHQFSGGRMYSRTGTCLEFRLEEHSSGYLVKRPSFDDYFLERAIDAGVEVIQDTDAVSIEQLRSGIRVLTVGDSYKAHLLVGADGVNGIVAKSVGLRTRWESHKIALCIAADIPVAEKDVNRCMSLSDTDRRLGVDIHFGLLDMGYGWCFPKKDELNVGIGCRMDKAANLKDRWREFVKRVESQKSLEFDLLKQSSFRIPFGVPKPPLVARRTMLVGDAAGLVSPLTGEGIYYAIKSGTIAAQVACEAVEMKRPSHVMRYEKTLREDILIDLSAAGYLANILYKSRRNSDLLLQIAKEDLVIREYLISFLAGVGQFMRIRNAIRKRLLTKHTLMALKLRF